MRYLRMLSNSVIAGALGAVYVAILFLQLNPHLPLRPDTVGPLVVTLALSYGVHLSVAFYALIVMRQLVAAELLSPGWISFRVLAWLGTVAAVLGAALMWLNLRSFAPMLEPDVVRRMATGAADLSVCALVFLLIALVHYSFGRRGSRVGASLFALAVVASVSLPLAARGPGLPPLAGPASSPQDTAAIETRATPRVVLLLLDGASLDFIATAAAQGRLPNFAKLLEAGAVTHLATVRPTQPAPVWAAIATGKWPPGNGIRSAARYVLTRAPDPLELLPDYCFAHGLVRFGFVTEEMVDSTSLHARPIWSILSGLGIPVGVVGWPVTYPAHPVRGYLVTDRFRITEGQLVAEENSMYPPDLVQLARVAAERPRATASEVPASADVGIFPPEVETQAYVADRMYEQVAAELDQSIAPRFSALYYRELDATGHVYLRYAMPRYFGDVSDEERREYGQVLPEAYRVVDDIAGRAMASLAEGDLLLLVSGFGMEPLGPGKRLVERAIGNAGLSGTHEGAPDGFLIAYGSAVAPGRKARAAVVDLVPTILYFLGLPVGRDMDGYARTDILRPTFTERRPITFIPSYDR